MKDTPGEWPKWWKRKTLSSPPAMGTPKLQLFREQLLMRVTGMVFYTRNMVLQAHYTAKQANPTKRSDLWLPERVSRGRGNWMKTVKRHKLPVR